MSRPSSDGGPEAKRRKVRKGTRSCWECRRRKIRCIYASDDAAVCVGCTSRGATCVSQEFADEPPATAPAPDPRLAQRMGRVEDLLEKLVERVMPGSYTAPEQHSGGRRSSSASVEDEEDVVTSCLRPSAVSVTPIRDMLATLRDDGDRSAADEGSCPPTLVFGRSEGGVLAKYAQISETLHALFPCQQDIDAITAGGYAPQFVIMLLAGYEELLAGRTESPSTVSEVPPVTSHPALLAKRLMQLTNCMQQRQPMSFPRLVTKEPVAAQMSRFVSVVNDLVATNDDLVGSVEGLETLKLLVVYHGNAGNLRKAWLCLRRTLAVAQLMGIDRMGDKALNSVDPRSNPSTRTKAKYLWFQINFTDRYLSLLLGLPAGTEDDVFGDPKNFVDDMPTDRLERLHSIIAGAIIKRNYNKNDPAFGVTQTIDCDLERAAESMGPSFWQPVHVDPLAPPLERMRAMTHMLLQMNHHSLLILLHLPFMMRDPKERRWDYSKSTCMNSSRDLLRGFLVFRNVDDAAFACRHADYGALTASMTLLLGYLDPKLRARGNDNHAGRTRDADRQLVLEVRGTLRDLADKNQDKLARETSDIITRLLPLTDVDIADHTDRNGQDAPVRLDIPYLGTINIKPTSRRAHPAADETAPAASTDTAVPVGMVDFQQGGAPTRGYYGVGGETPLDPHLQLQDSAFFTSPTMDDANFSWMQFESAGGQAQFPELAAEADQWTFQGFDATFFESLLNNDSH